MMISVKCLNNRFSKQLIIYCLDWIEFCERMSVRVTVTEGKVKAKVVEVASNPSSLAIS
jgi:hypothetical protein